MYIFGPFWHPIYMYHPVWLRVYPAVTLQNMDTQTKTIFASTISTFASQHRAFPIYWKNVCIAIFNSNSVITRAAWKILLEEEVYDSGYSKRLSLIDEFVNFVIRSHAGYNGLRPEFLEIADSCQNYDYITDDSDCSSIHSDDSIFDSTPCDVFGNDLNLEQVDEEYEFRIHLLRRHAHDLFHRPIIRKSKIQRRTKQRQIKSFLSSTFSRVSPQIDAQLNVADTISALDVLSTESIKEIDTFINAFIENTNHTHDAYLEPFISEYPSLPHYDHFFDMDEESNVSGCALIELLKQSPFTRDYDWIVPKDLVVAIIDRFRLIDAEAQNDFDIAFGKCKRFAKTLGYNPKLNKRQRKLLKKFRQTIFDENDAQLFAFKIDHGLDSIITKICDTLQGIAPGNSGLKIANRIQHLFTALMNVAMCKPHLQYYSVAMNLMHVICSLELGDLLISICKKIFFKIETMISSPDSQSISSPLVGPIVSLLGIALAGICYVKMDERTTIKSFMDEAGKLGRTSKGIENLFDVFGKLSAKIIELIKKHFFGIPPGSEELAQFESRFPQWMNEISMLVDRRSSESQTLMEIAKRDPGIAIKVESLFNEGLRFSQNFTSLRLHGPILSVFSTHFGIIKSLHQEVCNSGVFATGPRKEPILIYVCGKPGVGKSKLLWYLSIDMLRPLKLTNWHSQVYTRQVEQEFWDAYANQKICLYDDAFQMKDSAAVPNPEVMEVIRTGNLASYPLHMASLTEKSTTKFTSEIVMFSSNAAKPFIGSVNYPDAVFRRFDVYVHMRVKPAYCMAVDDPRLDTSKVPANTVFTDCWVFDIINPLTDSCVIGGIEYAKLVDICNTGYNKKMTTGANAISLLDAYMEGKTEIDAQMWMVEAARSLTRPLRKISKYGNMLADSVRYGSDAEIVRSLRNAAIDENWYYFYVNPYKYDLVPTEERFSYIRLQILDSHEASLDFSDFLRLAGDFLRYINLTLAVDPEILTYSQSIVAAIKEATAVILEHPFMTISAIIATGLALYCAHSYFKSDVQVEGNPSGDVRTSRIVRQVEGNPSGDVRTVRHKANVESSTAALDKLENNMADKFVRGEVSEDSFKRFLSTHCKQIRTLRKLEPESALKQFNAVRSLPGLYRNELDSGKISQQTYDLYMKNYKIMLKFTDKIETAMIPEGEGTLDEKLRLLIANRVISNLYRVSTEEVDDNVLIQRDLLNCFFVRGRTAVIAEHALDILQRSEVIILRNALGVVYKVKFDACKITYMTSPNGKRKANMLISFPVSVPDHADMIKHIATSDDLSKFSKVNAYMVTLLGSNSSIIPYAMGFSAGAIDRINVNEAGREAKAVYRDLYIYKAQTVPGTCGSPIFANSTAINNKLLGLHVAGQRGVDCGYSERLSRNEIENALPNCTAESVIYYDPTDSPAIHENSCAVPDIDEELEIDASALTPGPGFLSVGYAKGIHRATKTALNPSSIHGMVSEPTMEPAPLSPIQVGDEIVDPLFKGIRKAAVNSPLLDSYTVKLAAADIKSFLYADALEAHKQVLTDEQATKGDPNDPFIEPLNRKSSCGYTLLSKRILPGKRDWLGTDEDWTYREDLKRLVDYRISQAKLGKRTPALYVDTLKDEKRPFSKTRVGKTRVFTVGELDHTVAIRKYFGGFIAHCIRNKIHNEIAIGIDPNSPDWNVLANFLHFPKLVAGDYGNFDGTLLLEVLMEVFELIDDFYGNDGNRMTRYVLFKEIVNSLHIVEGRVYGWTHSQTSGNPMTTLINCLFNMLAVRMAYIQTGHDIAKFREYVKLSVFGDDNILGICDIIAETFNQHTMTEAMATFGLEYTSETKTGNPPKYRKLTEVSFLKRSFVWHPRLGRMIAPLEFGVILEMCNWVKTTVDIETQTKLTIETALTELWMHGRTQYELYAPQFASAFLAATNESLYVYPYEFHVRNRLTSDLGPHTVILNRDQIEK